MQGALPTPPTATTPQGGVDAPLAAPLALSGPSHPPPGLGSPPGAIMQCIRNYMMDLQTGLMGQFDLLNQQFDQLNRRQLYTKEQMRCVLDRITHLESRANEVQATTDGVFARLQALESTASNADATSVAATATTTTEDTAAAAAEAGVAPATGGAVGGTTAMDTAEPPEPEVRGTAAEATGWSAASSSSRSSHHKGKQQWSAAQWYAGSWKRSSGK